MNTRPNVLCLSGHDPSGGAGIQADIEAVAAQGAHAAVVVTCLTRQDTHNAYSVTPLDDAEFETQIRTLEADMRFAAFKVGLVGSPGQVDAIAALASRHPDVPLVVDPVLRAGGGATLAADPIARALKERLFGHALCLTPNAAEATLLCDGETDPDTCGARLSTGHTRVLLTGGDLPGDEIVNRLYRGGERVARQTCTRLPGRFHGSGCTLASALAARLAQGEDVTSAADAAQDYTWRCLKNAFQAGTGQLIPDRCRRFR